MKRLNALLVTALCVPALLCACHEQRSHSSANSVPAAPSPAPPAADKSEALLPQNGPPRQLILFYTGDTLSIPEANADYRPPQGGLPALANAITAAQSQILRYNQLRVQNEGGDAGKVRADYEHGLIGDNPYMLLDYGLWERPKDTAGDIYVQLYLNMYKLLHYTAVSSALYDSLSAERWQQYAMVAPKGFQLLITAGVSRGATLPTVPIVTRELYGQKWGVVAIPIPDLAAGAPEQTAAQMTQQMQAYVEQAAAVLQHNGCTRAILLASGAPRTFYQQLAQDKRFTVVIGAHPAVAAAVGYHEMPTAGALLLPVLNGGGRELGVCHLCFTPAGDQPFVYSFERVVCTDDRSPTYPFRKQVASAVLAHKQTVAARKSPAR